MVETVKTAFGRTGASNAINALGQRPMQARAYARRAAQHLLLKAPPAAGKSRALMFIALDKMRAQGLSKTIVCVPETSIGASFRSTELSRHGFDADWIVESQWNLCLSGVEEGSSALKVKAFKAFLKSDACVLVCTHATFRFGFDTVEADQGIEAFDDVFLAIDEFHHVSAADNNRLGEILRRILARGRTHVMAMTGSYFRGDGVPVLWPEDEDRFATVTFSYYEQLDGYDHLKSLSVNYSFYKGRYPNGLPEVLDTRLKTIIHIPHRGSAEAYADKREEVHRIYDLIGVVEHTDPATGFDWLRTEDGRLLKVADLVDDDRDRGRVKAALSEEKLGPDGRRDDVADRAKVDIIIALGMAKEGFDWVWCQHALTIGYRASLVEIVQIIGRATRDAPGKTQTRFTNLVAEPGVATDVVTDAVNDVLKAISGSLLMEQVLAPNFKFYRREDGDIREPIRIDADGSVVIGIRGLIEPPTDRAREICEHDMTDLMAAAIQAIDRRVLSPETAPEVATQLVLTGIIETRYQNLSPDETEAIRQDLAARMNLLTLAKRDASAPSLTQDGLNEDSSGEDRDLSETPNVLLNLVRRFINVRELDIDLIDSVNVFREQFDVTSKALNSETLATIQSHLVASRVQVSEDEARILWPRIKRFRQQMDREPNVHSPDDLERRLAEVLAWLKTRKAQRLRDEGA